MDLSILLISYNTKKLTLAALHSIFASLKNASFKAEVLVLDNNSQDKSVEAINKDFGNKVTLFALKENLGFGKGNNYLAKKAKGKHFLLLNSDIEVIEGAIPRLYDFFSNQKQFDFVGGKLLNSDKSPQPSCGPLYNPLAAFVALFLRGDYWGITRSSPTKVKQVGWVSGACILTRKETYLALGGFDEKIFMYMEEIDLFKRAADQNLTVGFCPEAVFIHHGFASSGNRSKPVINVFRGYLYYYHKHYGWFTNGYIRLLLKTKAAIGYTLGKALGNRYLIQTYDEANKVIDKMV